LQITAYASGGFAPKLTDSEVITLGVVGEFLGLDTDVGLWKYFRRHWPSWFPQSDREPRLPSKRRIFGSSSSGFISNC